MSMLLFVNKKAAPRFTTEKQPFVCFSENINCLFRYQICSVRIVSWYKIL